MDACLVRAEGACRTPSPLPAGQFFFPLAGRVCRGRSRCREAEASVLLVQTIARDTRWIGSEQANIARSGWARKGRRRKIKPGWEAKESKTRSLLQGSSSPRPKTLSPIARTEIRYSGTRSQEHEQRAWFIPSVAPSVFHMGWTPPSERQLLIPCDRGVSLGKKEGNAA